MSADFEAMYLYALCVESLLLVDEARINVGFQRAGQVDYQPLASAALIESSREG